MEDIPVVDFSAYSLDVENPEKVDLEAQNKLSKEIYHAFSTIGFVYLRNHGIHTDQVDQAFRTAKTFFKLPEETKKNYKKPDNEYVHGYIGMAGERLNLARPGDLKEMYNISPGLAKTWPDAELPHFRNDIMKFYDQCHRLALRLLEIIALSLDIKDRNFFVNCHQQIKSANNATTLRLLHYPPLPPGYCIQPGQVRLGEHSDYGTMTLLFQDDVGGLEVRRRDGSFNAARPIPDTILVNISDAMMRWTADRLVSTIHRVMIPEEEVRRGKSRQSMAFFVNPDSTTLIRSFDGSDKYPPIYHKDYLRHIFDKTYD